MAEQVMTKSKKTMVPLADKERARKFLLWLAIVSMIMLFAAFTSAFLVRRTGANWVKFDIPFQFTISTILILVSSVPMFFSTFFTKRNMRWAATLSILLTLGLGIAFSIMQFKGFEMLVKNNVFLVDKKNISGSFFYVITGLHLIHLIGGILALTSALFRSAFGKYSKESYLGLKLCNTYWHFLGILWVYLFAFLNFYQ